MIEFRGKSVFEGIAIGKIKVLTNSNITITDEKIEDISLEIEKFNAARVKAKAELDLLALEAKTSATLNEAEIFEIHKLMVDDLDLEDAVMAKINEGYNVLFSINYASNELAAMFLAMDDDYMRARSADVKDVCKRLIRIAAGVSDDNSLLEESIIMATDIAPSELVGFNKDKLLGIVTIEGSTSSHMAIIARSMSLPTIVDTGIVFNNTFNGKMCVIDGFNSCVIVDPEKDVLEVYQNRLDKLLKEENLRKQLVGKKSVTKDNKELNIYCNIGNSKDVSLALENDAEGIGLFRSEFLYLESTDYPTEEFQFEEYKKTLEKMNGKTVIIRTMDIGADKQASYFNLPKEDNPALGLRSLRICFERPEIMKTQLRALYRASAYGNLKIMIPMIISVDEVLWVKRMALDIQNELKAENISFDPNVEIGIMIETPAAAIISDELALVADFFSIGSNDLTQYTLAIDRQNQSLDKIFNPKHKAILRLIKMAVDNAHKHGKWCGICGELGRNFDLTEFFVGIGIDELSVSAPYVLKLREHLLEIDSNNVDLSKFI